MLSLAQSFRDAYAFAVQRMLRRKLDSELADESGGDVLVLDRIPGREPDRFPIR